MRHKRVLPFRSVNGRLQKLPLPLAEPLRLDYQCPCHYPHRKHCLRLHDAGLFVGAFFDLFSQGMGGHLDERTTAVTFKEWAQILLRQRDPRFRKHRKFLFCVCALNFRREAIQNARWKLTGRVPRGVAATLAAITPITWLLRPARQNTAAVLELLCLPARIRLTLGLPGPSTRYRPGRSRFTSSWKWASHFSG